MKSIPLTRGMFTIVDESDYEWLNQWKWNAHNRNGKLYAARGTTGNKTVSMHREIMKTPKGMETDHRNGDSLDNRRENLRISTRMQNNQNASIRKDSKSGYRGVHFFKPYNKWAVYIQANRKSKFLGYFTDPKEAAIAYNDKAKQYFGEFARLNQI